MKKLLFSTLLLTSTSLLFAADPTKFEGTATCAKCDLKVAEKCRAAVIVKAADGTKQTYLTEPNDKAKQLHSEVCQQAKPVKGEGEIIEQDGQKVIKITKFLVD